MIGRQVDVVEARGGAQTSRDIDEVVTDTYFDGCTLTKTGRYWLVRTIAYLGGILVVAAPSSPEAIALVRGLRAGEKKAKEGLRVVSSSFLHGLWFDSPRPRKGLEGLSLSM